MNDFFTAAFAVWPWLAGMAAVCFVYVFVMGACRNAGRADDDYYAELHEAMRQELICEIARIEVATVDAELRLLIESEGGR